MVLAFAGRRAQSIAGDLEAVATRVRRLLAALAPTAVVGAAADGADLLVVEAALAMGDSGPAVHIVLPTPRDVFREPNFAMLNIDYNAMLGCSAIQASNLANSLRNSLAT